jgi:hypothetical protein
MKNLSLALSALSIAALVAGCKPSGSSTPGSDTNADTNAGSAYTNTANSFTQQTQNAKEGISNAWESGKGEATNAWTDMKNGSTNAWDKTKEVAGNMAEDTKDAATNAWGRVKSWFESDTNSINDYSYSQKDAYVGQAQTNTVVLDQNISTLSDRASSTSTAPDAIQTVKDRRADLDKKLSDLTNATEAQWSDAKAAFQKSYDSVKDAIKQAWNTLSKQG